MVDLADGTAAARGLLLLGPLPARDGADGFWTATLIAALCRPSEEAWALCEYPGAATWLQPDVAPVEWLGWLAAGTGARLLPSMTEADQRTEISSPFDRRAGKNDAIVELTKRYLTGEDPYVNLLERHDPSSPEDDRPDDLTIITRTAETPADTTALELAWERVIPVDITVHHVVSTGPIIDEGTLAIDDVAVPIDSATLADITEE